MQRRNQSIRRAWAVSSAGQVAGVSIFIGFSMPEAEQRLHRSVAAGVNSAPIIDDAARDAQRSPEVRGLRRVERSSTDDWLRARCLISSNAIASPVAVKCSSRISSSSRRHELDRRRHVKRRQQRARMKEMEVTSEDEQKSSKDGLSEQPMIRFDARTFGDR